MCPSLFDVLRSHNGVVVECNGDNDLRTRHTLFAAHLLSYNVGPPHRCHEEFYMQMWPQRCVVGIHALCDDGAFAYTSSHSSCRMEHGDMARVV